MDRAHRIGQKRVVNVYRLITAHTIEERILGLQRFKLAISASIINDQNASLDTMNTQDLLDLFQGDKSGDAKDSGKESGSGKAEKEREGRVTMAQMLKELEERADADSVEAEYADAFSMDPYLS